MTPLRVCFLLIVFFALGFASGVALVISEINKPPRPLPFGCTERNTTPSGECR